MNKTELIKKIAEQGGFAKKDTAAVVNTMLEVIASELKQGEKIQLFGFGSFAVRERTSRQGKNPRTGEVVSIPAVKVAAFRSGKELKESLNK